VSDEPEYIKRLRERSARAAAGARAPTSSGGGGAAELSIQEKEAVRWARATAGTDLRAVRNLGGARYVLLIRVQSVTGETHHSLEGLGERDALLDRLKSVPGRGEEVLGAYEVRGGRPISIETDEGQTRLVMGTPRPGANPMSPEQMLRKAAADAAHRARTRPHGDRDGGKRGGGGGRRG
jgi:hypothetical protein